MVDDRVARLVARLRELAADGGDIDVAADVARQLDVLDVEALGRAFGYARTHIDLTDPSGEEIKRLIAALLATAHTR